MSHTCVLHVFKSCATASLLVLAAPVGCTKPPPRVTPPIHAAASVESEVPARECPRLPRGKRIWTGFTGEVSDADMHVALDVIRPIEAALGEAFCAPEHARCRPHHFTRIELSDALPSSARVRLTYDADASEGSLELVMLFQDGAFVPERESLAIILAPCID